MKRRIADAITDYGRWENLTKLCYGIGHRFFVKFDIVALGKKTEDMYPSEMSRIFRQILATCRTGWAEKWLLLY